MVYFFTFSPIKRLIFTQKGTFDFEVFSHIHILRSMFFCKTTTFLQPKLPETTSLICHNASTIRHYNFYYLFII